MSKIIKNLKSGNYSVVDNLGVSITQHFTECLEKEFADLEAKLAEKESEVKVGEFWHSAYQGKQLDYDKMYAELRKSYDEVEELKQQLHQIYSRLGVEAYCEDIHEQALKEIGILQEQLAEKDNKIQMLNAMIATLPEHDKELKEICNQDKISLCIEKLEKVRKHFVYCGNEIVSDYGLDCEVDELKAEIDNQIEELKKEMKWL